MGRIPEHVIDEVRARADIVQIVGRYVTLKKSGVRHWGLCPFHSEKTPSFQVHEEKQIFYCFGCSTGGDVFSFRVRHDGLDFPDAVRALAREVGVEIPDSGEPGGGRTARLHEIHDVALGYFRGVLRSAEGAGAQRYLEGRDVPADLLDRFQVGFAPGRWDGLVSHLREKRIPLDAAVQAGLVAARQDGEGHYDRFRGRVLFPIAEASGKIIGFGGRGLERDATPKYMNSPESPVYKKSRVLFGLPQALDAIRGAGRAVVVEGYFDVLALHRAGVQEAVAPCGTALTEDHARRIRRYTTDVVVLFDGDEAGRRAAERSLPGLLQAGLRVRAAFLPEGEDPDSLIARAGPEALVATLNAASPLLDHLIEEQLKGATHHAWAASDAASALAPFLRAVSDPVERGHYLRSVAARLQVPVESLDESIKERGSRRVQTSRPVEGTAPTQADAASVEVLELDPLVRALTEALVLHPDLVPLIDGRCLGVLPPGAGRVLLERIAETTRERGAAAVAHLCSGESERALEPTARKALIELVAHADPVERHTSEQAMRDCIARLETTALEREYRELATRVQSASDPEERNALLEAMQQKLDARRLLSDPHAEESH